MNGIGIIAQEVELVSPNFTIGTQDHQSSNISFVNTINSQPTEMLRIEPDGFYVRGNKIPVDANEGLACIQSPEEIFS